MRNLPQKAYILAALFLCCGAALADATPLPRSLVSRMLDARENFVAPKKPMRLETDPGADATKWPFDVARIEEMLEKALDRADDVSYRL